MNWYEDVNILDLIDCIKERAKVIEVSFKIVKDEDWANEWKKYYKPIKIGKSIIVKPTWEDMDYKICNKDDIVVELDPGMAFGTGTHESTRMCAELVERYVKNGAEVLDVGTGSGILGIISAKLGAKSVFGIDIDEVATKTAMENIKLNGVDDVCSVDTSILQNVKVKKYDVIIANIVADVIIDICNIIDKYMYDDSVFIVSGIISSRYFDVVEKIKDMGLNIVEENRDKEWVAMAIKK